MESRSLTKEFRALSKASSPIKQNCKQTAVSKLNFFWAGNFKFLTIKSENSEIDI